MARAIADNSIVTTCRKLMKEKRIIPFIGAGLSMRFNLPSWDDLIDQIATELGWDPKVFKLSGDNLQLAQYYEAKVGSIGPLRSWMDRAFNPSEDDILKSKAHATLAQLSPPLIYTTNYDEIIERSFKLNKKPYHTVSNINDIATIATDATQIVKFHGTFSDDKSLVLTEESYFQRLEFETALDIKLRSDILGKSLLFIGYGFRDINIRYIIYKLQMLRKKEKLNTPLPTGIMTTFTPGDVQRTILKNWDVETIELDPIDRNRSIDEFLEALV